jgi:hypothetical protein
MVSAVPDVGRVDDRYRYYDQWRHDDRRLTLG